MAHFDEIQDGLGVHSTPASYGAFPTDPYSHTPAFSGVQQPGMTGQVKEDVITRFGQLGIKVDAGEIAFEPVLLKQEEFTTESEPWCYSLGDEAQIETLEAGSMAFTLCGVPVIYRLAKGYRIQILTESGDLQVIQGNHLGIHWSQSLFQREQVVQKIVVDIPEAELR